MKIEAPDNYRYSTVHGPVISAVEEALEAVHPSNVRSGEVVVTGERDPVCIVIIPHHQLGGVSLVVWSDGNGIQVCWGYVPDLRDHDGIDLSIRVGPKLPVGSAESATTVIGQEMARPIFVESYAKRFRGQGLRCSIEVDGKRRVVGNLPLKDPQGRIGEMATSLVGDPLPMSVQVPIDRLRRQA